MAGTRERRSTHDPGRVLRDLAVMLADGGDCVTDMAAYEGQERLFGAHASETTTHRVIKSVDEPLLARVRAARAAARARVWDAGVRPASITLNIDATLLTAHSEKERAAGTYKRGYGFHPLCCYLDETGEALAAILRPGNAGSNTAEDHFTVLGLALEQLPAEDLDREILVRADIGGATHAFTADCRDARIRFSVGHELNDSVRAAILALPEAAWVQAIGAVAATPGSTGRRAWFREDRAQIGQYFGMVGKGLREDRPLARRDKRLPLQRPRRNRILATIHLCPVVEARGDLTPCGLISRHTDAPADQSADRAWDHRCQDSVVVGRPARSGSTLPIRGSAVLRTTAIHAEP